MNPFVAAAGVILLMLLLLAFGVPIAFSMIVAGFLGLWFVGGLDTAMFVVRSTPYNVISSWLFAVVPMFLLMGSFALYSGVTRDVYAAAHKWLGRLPGGLAITTVFACAGFALCTGSSVACAAAVGKVAIPEMMKYGYDRKLTLGCISAAGTLGILIPPSISLVLYGIVTGTPIGPLLMAGFIPGIITALTFSLMIFLRVLKNPRLGPPIYGITWRERFAAIPRISGILVLAILVLGSIYTGIATVTEAAAVGAVGAFLIAIFRKNMTRTGFKEACIDAVRVTSTVFAIFFATMVLARFLAISGFTQNLTRLAVESGLHRFLIIAAITVVYIFLGMIIDPAGMMLLVVPISFPIILDLGFSPIWYGIFVTKMIELAMITPPVGMNVFVIKASVKDASLGEVFAGIWPFFFVDLINVAIFTVFPETVLFLPSKMGY